MSDTTILSATKTSDAEAVHTLIENGADLNVQDSEEQTPLIIATKCNDIEIARLLIEAGANLNIQDNYGNTALIIASKTGNIEIINILIDAGATIDIENKNGDDALSCGIRYDYQKVIKMVTFASENDIDPDEIQYDDIPAKITNHLIKHVVNIDRQNKYGMTPLMFVCTYSFRTTKNVELLLEKGANLNIQDKDGNTALIHAAKFGYTLYAGIVNCLIKANANLNIQNADGTTALIRASYCGRTEIVNLLIKAGANLNIQDEAGNTALIVATDNGYHSTDDEDEDENGNKCMHEYIEIARLLIEAGANHTIENEDGFSALMFAESNCPSILLMLEAL